MQVFLTNEDLRISAMELDDLRLNKQITEINQILLTYINNGGGHANHPINIKYKSSQGIYFLLQYLYQLCDEYYERNKKHHMGYFTLCGMCDEFLDGESNKNHILYKDTFGDNPTFQPLYIKGQKGKDQIITTDNVYERYRELLTDKWNNDIKEPKWTHIKCPKWYENDFNNTWLHTK